MPPSTRHGSATAVARGRRGSNPRPVGPGRATTISHTPTPSRKKSTTSPISTRRRGRSITSSARSPRSGESAPREDPRMSTNSTFLLVHGSWHDGGCWSAVAERLSDSGFQSLTPTLTGHSTHDDHRRVTHDDYVSSVLEVLDVQSGPFMLVVCS